mmetsp:Transcript_22068/g.25415  ORF Transcript_22068/g.25415 Transcript_22068/m.25415 type:complete len:83 (-) Transcript_22068:2009-2257(-)
MSLPDLSTVATCCPLLPPLPHANPHTPVSLWPSSNFCNNLPFAFQTKMNPFEEDPDATYAPIVIKFKKQKNNERESEKQKWL